MRCAQNNLPLESTARETIVDLVADEVPDDEGLVCYKDGLLRLQRMHSNGFDTKERICLKRGKNEMTRMNSMVREAMISVWWKKH